MNKMSKDYTIAQLKEMARKKKISGYSKLRKQELMNALGLSGGRVRKQVGKSPLSGKDSCPLGDLKKYANRPSPPRPANDPGCRDRVRRGNDGLLYQSVSNKNGVYRWVKY